jgi:hypothetical protein
LSHLLIKDIKRLTIQFLEWFFYACSQHQSQPEWLFY